LLSCPVKAITMSNSDKYSLSYCLYLANDPGSPISCKDSTLLPFWSIVRVACRLPCPKDGFWEIMEAMVWAGVAGRVIGGSLDC